MPLVYRSLKISIKKRIEQAIQNKIFPGSVIGIVLQNRKRLIISSGKFAYESTSEKIEPDSIFDVASITKSIPTACLALYLIDQGKLKLSDKLTTFLQKYQGDYREQITFFHLLTQTLSFKTVLSTIKDQTPKAILNSILKAKLAESPGKKFCYTNTTSILLSLAIEKILGQTLDQAAEEIFFKPLKMFSTTFHPEKLEKSKIVPTEIDPWRGKIIHAEIHDESAYLLKKIIIPGSAGLFSNAPDLLNFLEMLLNKGCFKDRSLLSPHIISQISQNQIPDLKEHAGLGFELNQPYMGQKRRPNTFGKTGFTGCAIIANPDLKVGIVILSNYTYPKRKPDKVSINSFRENICDIVYDCINHK